MILSLVLNIAACALDPAWDRLRVRLHHLFLSKMRRMLSANAEPSSLKLLSVDVIDHD